MATETGTYNGWQYRKTEVVMALPNGQAVIKKEWQFDRRITHDGSAQSVDLPSRFPNGIKLNRVAQMWNDGTAKDFDIRAYIGNTGDVYARLEGQTTDTNQWWYSPFGEEFIFLKLEKLTMYYANTTNGKTVDVSIQLEEL